MIRPELEPIEPLVRIILPPKRSLTLNLGEEVPSKLRPLEADVHIDEEGVRAVFTELLEEESEQGRKIITGRIVDGGRLTFDEKNISIAGIPGAKGLLPSGRLPALMQGVQLIEEMHALCWGVLRRYMSSKKPSSKKKEHGVKVAAHKVILTAWETADVDRSLRCKPPDFWLGRIPDQDVLWPASFPIVFKCAGKLIKVSMHFRLDDLLRLEAPRQIQEAFG